MVINDVFIISFCILCYLYTYNTRAPKKFDSGLARSLQFNTSTIHPNNSVSLFHTSAALRSHHLEDYRADAADIDQTILDCKLVNAGDFEGLPSLPGYQSGSMQLAGCKVG